MILSWYALIPRIANLSSKESNNYLSFSPKNMDLSPWVTLLLINILCAAALTLLVEWAYLKKVPIYILLVDSKYPKYSSKFLITSIFFWVLTLRVFLTKSLNTAGSSIITVEKTWCKLMVRILLLFYLKRCTFFTPIIFAIV